MGRYSLRKHSLQRLARNTVASTLSAILALQPAVLAAQSIVVVGPDNGPRPIVDQALNGTTIINIDTPNGAGVSHAIFSEFSAEDLILNNNATNVDTTIAGWIEGNPNLAPGQAADLWIGEVIGGSASTLNGVLEVALPVKEAERPRAIEVL